MDLLPEEVLVEIFKYLSKSDLLNLTTVSCYFNDVIGTYPELFSKITLHFKPNETYFIRRRYSSIVIKKFIKDLHQPILDKIQNDVTSITIVKWHNGKEELLNLIKSCKNVNYIVFKKTQFYITPPESIHRDGCLSKIANLSLELLETDASILNIFRNCSVRKFYYDYTPRGDLAIPEVIEFLKVQDTLEDLTLSGFIVFFGGGGLGRVIFNDGSLSSVKFRLKRLTILKSPLCPTIHFNNFLKLHADSLEYVEISEVDNWFCTSFLASCNLTHLKLGKRRPNIFIPTQSFNSITHLTVDGNVDKNFLEYFPNIKYLSMTGFKVSPNQFEEIIKCDKLVEVSIRKTWLGGFYKFPALKKLGLKEIKFIAPEVFKVNNQIEYIHIEHCENLLKETVVSSIYEYCKSLKTFIVK